MHIGLLASIIVLVLILVIVFLMKGGPTMFCDEEEETVTTTTEEQPNIVGALKRQTEGCQFFVLDPVDQQKTWLNSNDDFYEDAEGKVWRLA